MVTPAGRERIPLFPLGTVLLPGGALPLQVFEPRYVALLRHLLGGDRPTAGEPAFGVVAIRQGYEVGDRANDLHDVGCLALIDRLGQPDTTRILLLCHGTRRFRLERIVTEAGTPWATGEVTWLPDLAGDEGRVTGLLAELGEALTAHAEATGQSHEGWGEHATADEASYRTAEQVGFDLADRQRLLEAPDSVGRLASALRVTRRETALAAGLGATRSPLAGPPSLN